MLALEFLNEVVHEAIVEVLSSQVRVSRRGLDFEDTLFDRQKGHIESPTAKVKDKNVPLPNNLLVEAIGDAAAVGSLMI